MPDRARSARPTTAESLTAVLRLTAVLVQIPHPVGLGLGECRQAPLESGLRSVLENQFQ